MIDMNNTILVKDFDRVLAVTVSQAESVIVLNSVLILAIVGLLTLFLYLHRTKPAWLTNLRSVDNFLYDLSVVVLSLVGLLSTLWLVIELVLAYFMPEYWALNLILR